MLPEGVGGLDCADFDTSPVLLTAGELDELAACVLVLDRVARGEADRVTLGQEDDDCDTLG